MFCKKKPHDQSNNTRKSLVSEFSEFCECCTIIDANDSNVHTCDIIELFYENGGVNHTTLEEQTTCTQTSSSTELEENMVACSICKNCTECQLQNRDVKMRETGDLMKKQDREHFNYYNSEANETASMSNKVISISPIFVDLTNEESTWKQTMRFGDDKSSEMSEPCIMIADSSSKLQRSDAVGSLATALRDRGPCVIPVQPNRSLPIRPAPPMPTRSAASIVTSRKTHSPILKLSKPVNLDVVEVPSEKSTSGSLTSELSEFLAFRQREEKSDEMILASKLIDRTNHILSDMANVVQITQEINSVKRKNSEDQNKEYEKEITKDAKKWRKSHEVDASVRVKNILKEYSKMCLADKEDRRSQQVMLELWDDKKCSSSVVMSTEPEAEKTKEICNKVVPPLRLKKIVREASTTDEYRNVEVNAESGNELNYRIITDTTPRSKSPSGYSSSFRCNVSAEKNVDKSILRNKNWRSSPKCDGHKIKYRHNWLRQKLRELRGKALELSLQMAIRKNADTNPQRSTRLQQMMNCYEKKIENVSKLLCKLSASIPSADDIVDLDYENKLDEECAEKTVVDSRDIAQTVNGVSAVRQPASVSPSQSPGPPELSPFSPIDYEKSKSPDKVRDTPPVLPRVYIAIDPATRECMKHNLITAESWHGNDDNFSGSSIEKTVKILDNTDRTTVRSSVRYEPIISPISSSELESPGSGVAGWDETSPKLSSTLKNPEIVKIQENTKTFDDVDMLKHSAPPITSDNFLGSTINIEIDGGDTRDSKELTTVQECLDEVVTQAVKAQTANEQVTQQKQAEKQEQNKSSEALPSSSLIPEGPRKSTEHTVYDSEEKVNSESRTITNTFTAAQEVPMAVGRPEVANATNILQLQSHYYGSSIAQDNMVYTNVIQNERNAQKVTSSVSQSVALNPTIPLTFAQPGPTVSSSNQQCIGLPNSEVAPENVDQRNEGNHIMTEQFPTLGNWVTRMSKKQATKSKSKLQSEVTLPTASTAEVARVSELEMQKMRTSVPSNATRNNIVNVAPQWNMERWQRQQQHQQRQQQLYAATSSAVSAVRPRICPPISVTQYYPPNYPPNYAIDPYGNGAGFGYHTAICPYDYSYHSRLHTAAPSTISGYQIPLQDPHSLPLRQMQHLDKRFPPHLQDTAARHFATDILRYPPTLSAGNYQHTAAGLDFNRLRTTTVTQNGSTASAACLPPLMLPSQPSLPATTQQTLAHTASLAGYSSNNNQCGRNRMIPDVVAAAAAAAVVAAASIDRQRGPLPSYGRTDTEMVSGDIGGMIDESTQLMANRTAARERLPEQVQPVAGSVGVNSQLNNGNYQSLQNLILDRLPYIKTNDAYSQPAIFSNNAQEAMASSVPSSTYESNTTAASKTISKNTTRKERNCDTPHLGKVNHTLEITHNLTCSNCGLSGSMFKCLGCRAAFYCNERCQTRHWRIHVEKCPKRMPKLKKLV